MLDYDIENVAKIISEETGDSLRLARATAKQLMGVHPDLYPLVKDWINGKKNDFEFNDISISYIQKKGNYSYIHALLIMSRLINNPDSIKEYKEFKYKYVIMQGVL